jgi:hypothetical protein
MYNIYPYTLHILRNEAIHSQGVFVIVKMNRITFRTIHNK